MTESGIQTIHKASEVAKYFIYLASQDIVDIIDERRESEGITNLKLQKVLYFAQAYYLAALERPLFGDEIEAWDYGPVIREVYDEYKINKGEPIFLENDTSSLPVEDKEILRDVVWEDFGRYSTAYLVAISHSKPWKDAISKKPGKKIISNKSIQKYYTGAFR